MATRAEVYQAILNADKAGDSESVRALGAYLKTLPTDKPNAPDAIDQGAMDFAQDMPTWRKAAAGAGKAGYDVARGLGQMVGIVDRQDVAEARRLDAPLMKTGAGTGGNILGNVAMLAPAAMIPGANTLVGGAALGAGMGLMQPSESTGETVGNVALGGAFGAAVPAISRLWQTGKAIAEPLSDKGKEAILGRALNRAAGKDAPNVAKRLATAQELVPGSVPTVGQASGNAGIAAMERAASAGNPDVTNAISDLMRQQNSARVNVLTEMAGSDGQRAFFAADRDAVAGQLYGAARKLGVDPAKLTPDALANIAKFAERVPDEILAKAKQLAKISGEPMTDATSVQGMHWIKLALDDNIGAAQRAGNATLERAYVGLKNDFLQGLDELSPSYAGARKTYAAMSKPINQMDVAGTLAQKSIDPLTGNLRASNYARALNDKTAAQATGLPTATLEGTMEPAQMNALQSLLLDLQRADAAKNVGRGVGSDTVQKLAYTNMIEQAGVPTMLRDFSPAQVLGNVVARGGDAVYARANRELSQQLAEIMLDPAKAAQLMQSVGPTKANAIMQLLQRGASGLALSAPALANAQK